jgi:LmbE family N-acetylglucosaminyl deacetylase
MRLSHPDADIFVPDGTPPSEALARTTHLCVGAHADDIEIMAYSAIAECYGSRKRFFTGVVATDGSGSPRAGRYANVTNAEMRTLRRDEQRNAARLGKYCLQLQLAHPGETWKSPGNPQVAADLATVFGGCAPSVVFLHNPADKHDTHVGVLLRCLEALRALPLEKRPKRVLGCEVWRDLDWLPDSEKVALNAGKRPALAKALLRTFDSQIEGGKRYDLAALGRRVANATFRAPHETDREKAVVWATDLTPAVREDGISIRDCALGQIDRFRADVAERLERLK